MSAAGPRIYVRPGHYDCGPGDFIVAREAALPNGFSWRGSGQLKIAVLLNGEAILGISGQCFSLNSNLYHVTNADEEYEVHMPKQGLQGLLLVEFSRETVSDISSNLGKASGELAQHIYPHDSEISPQLLRIWREARSECDPIKLEEEMLYLCRLLMLKNVRTISRASHLSGKRKSTRNELLKRLLVSVDYAHSNLHLPLTLTKLAEVAALSRSTFSEGFHQAFGEPPHRFVRKIRLNRAQRLLSNSDIPIQEIALETGFASASSFCAVFSRHLGVSPSKYRLGN